MPVKVDTHREFGTWLATLDSKARNRVLGYLALLAQEGPALQRPHACKLKGTARLHELRLTINTREFRILYSFLEDRNAVVLLGGDKTGDWVAWYPPNIVLAEKRLLEFEKEKKAEVN